MPSWCWGRVLVSYTWDTRFKYSKPFFFKLYCFCIWIQWKHLGKTQIDFFYKSLVFLILIWMVVHEQLNDKKVLLREHKRHTLGTLGYPPPSLSWSGLGGIGTLASGGRYLGWGGGSRYLEVPLPHPDLAGGVGTLDLARVAKPPPPVDKLTNWNYYLLPSYRCGRSRGK